MKTVPGMRRTLRFVRRFDVPPARVFEAWLDPALAGRWLFATATRPLAHVEIDARPRGAFRLVERCDGGTTVHAGRYVTIARPRHLEFTLALESMEEHSRVSLDVTPTAAGCRVVVTHDGVPRAHAGRVGDRWAGMLYGLDTLLTEPPSPPSRACRNAAPRARSPSRTLTEERHAIPADVLHQ